MCICIELENVFDKAESISVYNGGKAITYNSQGEIYTAILKEWNRMTDGAHRMPAFGVSLNAETVKELNKGLWVEFAFKERYECDGLPFEKLLIAVCGEDSGFNLIRYTKEYGYDGRCFYYDLVNKNMSVLYELLCNL